MMAITITINLSEKILAEIDAEVEAANTHRRRQYGPNWVMFAGAATRESIIEAAVESRYAPTISVGPEHHEPDRET